MNSEPIFLEARNVSKSFGATRALVDVDLEIRVGEVLALVGENGAGKSTLGKILAGVVQRDTGEVIVEGTPTDFHSVQDGLDHKIAIVLQEFNLIPEMTVAENIFLTRKDGYGPGGWKRTKQQITESREFMESLHMDFGIDPTAQVSTLSIAQQQIVEIVRSVSRNAELFILDEPTAALGKRESDALLRLIRQLADSGKSVVIVTHRLDEIYAVSDRMVVLRDGIVRGSFSPKTTEPDELISVMVGRELGDELTHARTINVPGEEILSVEDLSISPLVKDCSLSVRRGEVVGLAGLVGSGRTELVRAIFGIDTAQAGEVVVNGRIGLLTSPLAGVRAGGAFVPEDRKTQGLHTELSIFDNLTMSYIAKSKNMWLKSKTLKSKSLELIKDLHIKTSDYQEPASSLSGGNQQKVVLGKWLMTQPDLLILDEPTRGIDVGARAELYKLINELVSQGMGALIISSELPEVIALSDRILVMSNGRIVSEVDRDDATEEKIIRATEIGGIA